MTPQQENSIEVAVQAIRRGYTPVAIRDGIKRPYGTGWQHTRWQDTEEGLEQARTFFTEAAGKGAPDLGLLLGKPSGGLVDVDLDHPLALRLRDYFIPPTAMETGRAGRVLSHRWYRVEDSLMDTRQFKLPDGSVIIEYRSTGAQTVIPPSTHPSGEKYLWEGEPWGGERGPAQVNGKMLMIQVTLLAMTAVLLENWPEKGGRHEAYLHLAGGLLRYGDGVHEYWERNLPVLIRTLAEVTHDEDGPETRVAEVMGSTLQRLRSGGIVSGFPKLAEVIGADHAEQVRRWARDIESMSGFVPEVVRSLDGPSEASGVEEEVVSTLPPEERNPMEERLTSWDAVDLEPYLSGQVTLPEPSVLRRTDGKGLFYPGRVNSIYGKSESAKSWISLYACAQEMNLGERVMFVDFEDEPAGTVARLKALGVAHEDMTRQFRYVHPEEPLASMQRNRFGSSATEDGKRAEASFQALLDAFDPTLVVADGMTVIYGLHGLDTNDAMSTDVITSWLKRLTGGGRRTVVVIDHTGKGGGPGASPIGAHHKIAMIQGSAIRADAIDRPMPGAVGRVNLVVYKDRPGAVRQISSSDKEQIAAEVTMDSTEEGVTRVIVSPPDPNHLVIGASDAEEAKLAHLARAEERKGEVLALFQGDLDARLKTPEVAKELDWSTSQVWDVWGILLREGVVVREGENRHTRFRLRDPQKDS